MDGLWAAFVELTSGVNMLYQIVRKSRVNGETDYASVGIATYQQAIDWCSGANLHCAEHRIPFQFEFYKLPGVQIDAVRAF